MNTTTNNTQTAVVATISGILLVAAIFSSPYLIWNAMSYIAIV